MPKLGNIILSVMLVVVVIWVVVHIITRYLVPALFFAGALAIASAIIYKIAMNSPVVDDEEDLW